MAWVIWLVIGGALLVAEMFTLTFYLLWLGLGALSACGVALLFPEAYLLQVAVGCLTALVLTAFTRKLTGRLHAAKGYRDAIEDLVGKQGIVIEDIAEGGLGIVRVGSETWSAKSDVALAKGQEIIVVHRGSTVLEVQKWGGL